MEQLLTGKMISVDDEMYEFFRTRELAEQALDQRNRLYPLQYWQLVHTMSERFEGWHLERYESLETACNFCGSDDIDAEDLLPWTAPLYPNEQSKICKYCHDTYL